MIREVHTRGGYALAPTGDSLVSLDWRHDETRHTRRYPTRGCHGAPLTRLCPDCYAEPMPPREAALVRFRACDTCGGRGYVYPPLASWARGDIP